VGEEEGARSGYVLASWADILGSHFFRLLPLPPRQQRLATSDEARDTLLFASRHGRKLGNVGLTLTIFMQEDKNATQSPKALKTFTPRAPQELIGSVFPRL